MSKSAHRNAPADVAKATELLWLVYDDLRRLAASMLRKERPGQTLQATALVHEAWMRISAGRAAEWVDRTHFFLTAAEAMRHILVDQARRRSTIKHGGRYARHSVEEALIACAAPPDEIVHVHEALDDLNKSDPTTANLVKLHYFSGFTIEEAGNLLGISRASAYRLWTYARTWLRAALHDPREEQ